MKFILGLVVSLILLVGCGTVTRIPPPQLVNVPIKTKCEPITNVKDIGVYPLSEAKKEMSLYEKLKLALQELELINDQNTELKAALKECTK